MVPIQSPIYKALEEIYLGYLFTVSQNMEHKLGPSMIHRGKALLDQVDGAEALKGKEGLKDMRPIDREVKEALGHDSMDIEKAANIFRKGKLKLHLTQITAEGLRTQAYKRSPQAIWHSCHTVPSGIQYT